MNIVHSTVVPGWSEVRFSVCEAVTQRCCGVAMCNPTQRRPRDAATHLHSLVACFGREMRRFAATNKKEFADSVGC